MLNDPAVFDDQLRVAALRRYLILDTPPEQSFDRLTAFAAQIFDMPLAFISLLDKDRQWIKSSIGMDLKETDREVAFCNLTISSSNVMVIPDTYEDRRFINNPLVTEEPDIRFYAGAPLTTKDGYNLGAFCVANTSPHHTFTESQQSQLAELAYFVMELLESRLLTQVLKNELVLEQKTLADKLSDSEKRFHLLAQNSRDIILVTTQDGTLLYVSPACKAIIDYAPEELVGKTVFDFTGEEDRPFLQNAYNIALKTSNIKPTAFRFKARNGEYRWLEVATQTIFDPVTGEAIEIQCSCRDISRRKEAEDALKKREQEYRTLYTLANRQAQELSLLHRVRNSLYQTLDLADLLGKVVEAVSQELGYTRVGLFLVEGTNLTLKQQTGHMYDFTNFSINKGVNGRVVQSGKPAFVPVVQNDPDFISAEPGIVSEICVPLLNEGLVVGTLDIESTTPGELTQDDLRILEAAAEYISLAIHRAKLYRSVTEIAERLQTVINNAPLIVYTLDNEGKFTFSAGKSLLALGFQPNQSVGRSVFDVYRNNSQIVEDARRVLSGETFSNFVELGGRIFDSFYYPIKDEKGKVMSVIGVSTDVTERKHAEKALQREQEFALQVMDHMGQGLIVLDPVTSTITYANQAYARMLGYSKEEIVGKTSFDIIPPKYHSKLKEERSLRLNGKGSSYEIELMTSDRRLICVDVSSEGFFQEGNLVGIIEVSTDITERKQVELGLRRALEMEKELGELKDRIISTASHEFRTPLSAIISAAELLVFYNHKWSEEKKAEILGRITVSARKLTDLVEDILIYNRAESGRLECVRAELDLSAFCAKLIEELQLSAREDKVLRLMERGERQKAFLDVKLLGYILNNLLSNALKYSPAGGKVELELVWSDNEVVFKVKDEGIGIPLKDQASLFEPFQRASNVGNISGSGFGLAIVKRSLAAHAGKISLISQEGVGTTFIVTLPLSAPERKENQSLKQDAGENLLTGHFGSSFKTTGQVASSTEHWWLLERAIEASSSGVIIIDSTQKDAPLIYVSKGFERMTGFLSEEVLGSNYRFLQGEDLDQAGLEELRQAQLEERDCRVTLRNYRKNGSLFWSELQLSAVRNGAGKLVYFVGIQTDVSDRIKAQQALDQSEHKFKALVENTPDAIAQFDRQGKYLYINPGMVNKSHGTLTPERIIGKSVDEVGLSAQRVATFQENLSLVLETGKPASFETIQVLSGSEPEYFQVRMVPEFKLGEKEIVSVITIARDITELKLTNKALEAAEARLSEILASITDAFFAVDLSWNITYLNRQTEKLLGRSQKELLGHNLWEVFPGSQTAFYQEKYQLGMREMVAFHFEEYFPTLGTWFEIHGYPLDRGLSFYFQDITARKEVEEQLMQSERAYRHLMEQAGEAIYITNLAGQIQEINEECCKLTGYSKEELLQMNIYDLAPGDLPSNKRVPTENLPKNQTLRGTRQLRRKDGVVLTIEASLRILEDSRVVGIIRRIPDAVKKL